MNMERKRKWPIVLTAITSVLVMLALTVELYLDNYYPAQAMAQAALTSADTTITIEMGESYVSFEPQEATQALIFYPGAKVEYTAYADLAYRLAEQGVLVILVQMPKNMAIFDVNAADEWYDRYPEISSWYIGGHSMGGAAAGMYAAEHANRLTGVIFLAAYTTTDLSGTGLRTLSVYGTQDGVLNRGNYAVCKQNLPKGERYETIIEGGCHAYFGDYGAQLGDGTPAITYEEQMSVTVDSIVKFIQ